MATPSLSYDPPTDRDMYDGTTAVNADEEEEEGENKVKSHRIYRCTDSN